MTLTLVINRRSSSCSENIRHGRTRLPIRRFRLLNLLVLGIAIHLFSGDSSPRVFYFQRDKGSDFVARSLNGDFRWKRPGGQNFFKKVAKPKKCGEKRLINWRVSHARRGACELSGWRWALGVGPARRRRQLTIREIAASISSELLACAATAGLSISGTRNSGSVKVSAIRLPPSDHLRRRDHHRGNSRSATISGGTDCLRRSLLATAQAPKPNRSWRGVNAPRTWVRPRLPQSWSSEVHPPSADNQPKAFV